MSACPKCRHTHVAGDVVALTRFAGISGYRTADGAIHQSRRDGQDWLCAKRANEPVNRPGGESRG